MKGPEPSFYASAVSVVFNSEGVVSVGFSWNGGGVCVAEDVLVEALFLQMVGADQAHMHIQFFLLPRKIFNQWLDWVEFGLYGSEQVQGYVHDPDYSRIAPGIISVG